MAWWGWIIGGAILFGAELTFVNAQFYLVFVGAAAMLVGLLSAATALAEWAQWGMFAALSVGLMVAFRSRLYNRFRRALPELNTGPAGAVLTLQVPLSPGESCQTEYRGTLWTVRNESARPIAAGARAQVMRVRDLTLLVEPAP
ncbi:MAG TPA: NfeD family protein [Steroidobacteraceae bacterium]|jgi:membrane protein implicated in regulation of membrane protease activity